MLYCPTCDRKVPEEFAFDGAGTDESFQVHAVDTGPGHHEVDVHRLTHLPRSISRLGILATDHRYDTVRPSPAADPDAVPPVALARLFGAIRMLVTVSHLFWADISYYQKVLTDAYNRRMICFRLSFSVTLVDPHAGPNLSWALSALARSRIIALMGYHVWYPGNSAAQIALMKKAGADRIGPRGLLMVDLETWGGKIRGDHSSEITAFIELVVHTFLGGNYKRVRIYGNQGDLAALYPHRPSWLARPIVARYSSQAPTIPYDAQQYTDGSSRYPVAAGYPRSSGSVGSCDHNVALMTESQFLTAFGIAPHPVPVKKKAAPWPWPSTNTVDRLGNWHNPSSHVHGGPPEYDPKPVAACIVDVHAAFGAILHRSAHLDVGKTAGHPVWGEWGYNTDTDWILVRRALKLGNLTDKTMSHSEYSTLMQKAGYTL